jgi:hypothetical protein
VRQHGANEGERPEGVTGTTTNKQYRKQMVNTFSPHARKDNKLYKEEEEEKEDGVNGRQARG